MENVTAHLDGLPVRKLLAESPPLVAQLQPEQSHSAPPAPPSGSATASLQPSRESSHEGRVGKQMYNDEFGNL